MLNYILLNVVVNGHNCNATQHAAACCIHHTAAVEISMLDYNVAVRSVDGV